MCLCEAGSCSSMFLIESLTDRAVGIKKINVIWSSELASLKKDLSSVLELWRGKNGVNKGTQNDVLLVMTAMI